MDKGFKKSRFVKTMIPKEFYCKFCRLIMNKPVSCKNCFVAACKECCEQDSLSNRYCTHKSAVPHNEILEKLNYFLMSCKNKSHGCLKLISYEKLANHEECCAFNKFSNCQKEHRLNVAKGHSPCPLEVEDDGLEFKLHSQDNHLCGEWLREAADNYEERLKSITNENNELRRLIQDVNREMNEEEEDKEEKIKALDRQTFHFQTMAQREKEYYDAKIKELEAVSKSTHKVIKAEAEERAIGFWKFTMSEIDRLKNSMENASIDFLERVNSLVEGYRVSMEDEGVSVREDPGISLMLSSVKKIKSGKSTVQSTVEKAPRTKAFK